MELEERIIHISKTQFLQFGIKSVSMDDIASKLGVSKKTIYKYFKDKKTIVLEVTKHLINEAQTICTQKCNDSNSAIDELLKLIEFINYFFQNMNANVLFDLEKYYPESFVLFHEHQHVFLHDSLVENLKRGIKEGLFRSEIDIEITARLRMGQIKAAFDPELFPVAKFNLREVQLQSMDLYMMGISTIKGRALIENFKNENEK